MQFFTFLAGILTALCLGMVIGVERQWRSHPAGLRTNTLVALGAALFVSVSGLVIDTGSPTRIASYVVSGLGFLGGGVILRDGMTVKGLNTAATLWCSGAVGTLAGSGFPLEAIAGTLAVLGVNLGLRPVVRWIDSRQRTAAANDVDIYYRLRIECESPHDGPVRQILLRHIGATSKLTLQGLSTEDLDGGKRVVLAEIYSSQKNDRALEDIVARVSIEPDVSAVSWRHSTA